jgi:acyl-CoA reductase-like NAD-dependent aldehyde dehydrogenase
MEDHPMSMMSSESTKPVQQTTRTDADYAIEFGRYLADAAEQLMAEMNRVAEAGEDDPCSDHWRALQSAVYEFRKRADRADRKSA